MSLGKHILILVMLFIGAFNAFASDNDYNPLAELKR